MFDFQSRLPGHWHDHRLSVVIEYNYGENRISTKKNTIHIKPRRFYTRSRTIAEKERYSDYSRKPYSTNSDNSAIVIMQTSSFMRTCYLVFVTLAPAYGMIRYHTKHLIVCAHFASAHLLRCEWCFSNSYYHSY